MSELLAMLTPGAPPLKADMIRGTSKNKITAGDIAACLVHVDRHTYLYALSKFCLDDEARSELNRLAIAEAQRCHYRVSESEPDDVVIRLALAALNYSISASRCFGCNGVGQLIDQAKVTTCTRCAGSGNSEMSVRRLASILEVGRWRSQKVWMPRFQALVSDYQVRDDALHIVLRRGLQDG